MGKPLSGVELIRQKVGMLGGEMIAELCSYFMRVVSQRSNVALVMSVPAQTPFGVLVTSIPQTRRQDNSKANAHRVRPKR